MKSASPTSKVGRRIRLVMMLATISGCLGARAGNFASLCADRAAIEHVYYSHRTGSKSSFTNALPRAELESLVRMDLKKEAVLRDRYGVVITPAMLDAEVRRINCTTRAPLILAELKSALNDDANRFACAVAKPVLVERLLRDAFENDAGVHSAPLQQVDEIRTELIRAKQNRVPTVELLRLFKQAGSNQVSETSWQLSKRPGEPLNAQKELDEVRKRYGSDARILSSASPDSVEPILCFEDLPAKLQRVLAAQLRGTGDVSAVVETPGAFLLYLCVGRDDATLSVAALSVPKRSYEEWLHQRTEDKP